MVPRCEAIASWGTAFKLNHPKQTGGIWKESQLHVFTDGGGGAEPTGNLIFDAGGSLYGTAQGGNRSGGGIAFQLTADNRGAWKETVLHWFSNNGPGAFIAGLTFDSSGNLYGPTDEGALFRGTVVRLKRSARQSGMWAPSIIYTFQGSPDGAGPAARLIFNAAGSLYGTTQAGGTGQACQGGCGTVYELSR
ncbi:MAG: choice-of-anchor tandem repeat GloVer-containing protein [Terriglobales bacterium]